MRGIRMKRRITGIFLLVFTLALAISAENLALNKKYVADKPPESTYPDSGGAELTDGKIGELSIYDSAWSGHLRNEYRIFVVDLEDIYTIDSISLGALKDEGTGVTLPLWLCFAVSNDGKKWKSLGTLDYDEDELPTNPTVRMVYEFDAGSKEARYVAIKVNSGVWLFVDEIEIHGNLNSKKAAPSGLSLSQIDFEEIDFDY